MIVHLGDVAGTSRTFVQLARNDGLAWELRDVPPGRGRSPVRILSERAVDLGEVLRLRRNVELLHINYGVSGYYGWGARVPVVLHLHGTDVRQDLRSRWLGPVVRRSIHSADKVLVSTRDLLPLVSELRPDVEWFPAPLPIGAFAFRLQDQVRGVRTHDGPTTVFFCSRWDTAKGADELIDAARALRQAHPDWDIVGLDWGAHAAQAREVGVRLLPFLTQPQLRTALDAADVVVGQTFLGELGLTDLEAMLRARPLVARYTADAEAIGPRGQRVGPVPIWNTTQASIVEHVESIVAAGPADDLVLSRTEEGYDWVRGLHHPYALFGRLKQIYATFGATGRH